MERSKFSLWPFLGFAEHFRTGSLVEPNSRIDYAYGLNEAGHAQAVDIPCVYWLLKRQSDIALSSQIVDLFRFDPFEHSQNVTELEQVHRNETNVICYPQRL